MTVTHLIDNSAFNRLSFPSVSERLVPLMQSSRLGTCGVIELEALFSAQSPADFVTMARQRSVSLEYIDADEKCIQEGLKIQATLAAASQVRGGKIPDLLIAGVARANNLTVLHYDSDFDRIGELCGVKTEWVVPRGSI